MSVDEFGQAQVKDVFEMDHTHAESLNKRSREFSEVVQWVISSFYSALVWQQPNPRIYIKAKLCPREFISSDLPACCILGRIGYH